LSEYIAKAHIKPYDYRVVFLIQKTSAELTADAMFFICIVCYIVLNCNKFFILFS